MVLNVSFNGMGKPLPAVAISVARMAVIYVPLALIGNRLFGIIGIFLAYAIANFITGIVSYAWARASVQAQCDLLQSQVPVTPGSADPGLAPYVAADTTRRS